MIIFSFSELFSGDFLVLSHNPGQALPDQNFFGLFGKIVCVSKFGGSKTVKKNKIMKAKAKFLRADIEEIGRFLVTQKQSAY